MLYIQEETTTIEHTWAVVEFAYIKQSLLSATSAILASNLMEL